MTLFINPSENIMARVLNKTTAGALFKLTLGNLASPTARNGHHLRGKPPGVAKSLEQKLAAFNVVDEEVAYRVDIGLPPPQINKVKQSQERTDFLKAKRKDRDLSKQLNVPIDLGRVRKQWTSTSGPEHVKTIADHYGIFSHLFDRAYFYPRVPLQVQFLTGDVIRPVYYGNLIKPCESKTPPTVLYESDDKSLWTLILSSLDGNLLDQSKELVHWMVGNIPSNKINEGEVLFDYLQPFPPKGTGCHRYVFVLYKQEKKIDYSQLKQSRELNDLRLRTFSTLDFYKARQDDLTPGGLCFFQSDWDSSLHQFYHEVLKIREPVFEYDFDPPYIKPEKWYPIREPFNLYMDKYRDPKEINKEFLSRKLKNVHPFKPDPEPLPYPNAVPFGKYIPTWLKLEIRKSRLKWGRINDIE